ncbi:MAG: VC_2705 family sodium/solute symporter, partial [Gammaproteobacteria bacterium]|nr:VC_2705 family sodium/solute symporter [Gammaproteobacteria bacterium]
YEERPRWMRTWERTGLVGFEDKNGDGRVQYYNDANPAFAATADEYGWQGNELTVDNDIMVLANPEIAGLPNWVVALVAAGGIAAALSTAAGLLLVISAAVSHDLVKGIFLPGISDRNELRAGRVAAAFAILVAGYLGFDPPGWVAQVVAFAFGLAAASLFPAILLGIFMKRANKEGAIAGMLVGLVFTYGYIEYFKGLFLKWAGSPWGDNVASNWLFGISPEGIGVIGMLLNFTVAIVVSHLTSPPPEDVQHMVEHIRVPRATEG